MLKLTVISVLLCIGPLKLMPFNELCLLYGIAGLWTEVYVYGYIYMENIMW